MRDRGGQLYVQGVDLVGLEKVPTFTHVLSPTRQAKKALGLGGRQYTKFRKTQRRLLGVDEVRSLEGLVNLNVGEQHGANTEVSALPQQEMRNAERAATDSAGSESGAPEAGGERGTEATQG